MSWERKTTNRYVHELFTEARRLQCLRALSKNENAHNNKIKDMHRKRGKKVDIEDA